MPKLQILESMAREGKADMQSYMNFLEVYKVNVFAVAELTKLMIPYLQKGSHVLTISSMGGIQGSMKFPGLAAYSSALFYAWLLDFPLHQFVWHLFLWQPFLTS